MIEICCGSFEDAVCAWKAGADRIELNCALELGGLTPSVASLKLVKKYTDLEVICMVRPRPAGFCYTKYQYEQAKLEAQDLLRAGADGLSFGFLMEDGTLDENRIQEFTELCHAYDGQAVFNRAFDVSADDLYWEDQDETMIRKLIDLGVDRLLTSGKRQSALEGSDTLFEFENMYNDEIEIMAASGILPENVEDLLNDSEVVHIHASCKAYAPDKTTSGTSVSFEVAGLPYKDSYQVVDSIEVKRLIGIASLINPDTVDI